ncbi:hypothetical protein C471_02040 [Halorubrum saccharovorum DSM 1137]|uniref:Uncharacterized protein n=1 Tax=Halorubrum saccharovorum DSM 1137 TaxID=1227484 RepID=M0E8M7_9EURY|nr:hypothetical protein C471_02040 [Halorubrum saccharovorum DSM 1137]
MRHLEEDWKAIHDGWDHRGNIQSVEDDQIPLLISTPAAIEDTTAHLILAYVANGEPRFGELTRLRVRQLSIPLRDGGEMNPDIVERARLTSLEQYR